MLCNPTLRRCGKSPIQSSSPDPFQARTKMCSPVKHWAQSARGFFLCVKGNMFVCAYARGLTCLAQSHALWSEWLVFFSVGRGSVYIVPTL